MNKKGFTLIELLVVVLIIGILAAVALPQYQVAVKKARLATVMSNVKAIVDSLEVYYMANGAYPNDDVSDLGIEIGGCNIDYGGSFTCNNATYDYYDGSSYVVGGFLKNYNGLAYLQWPTHDATKAGTRECWADSGNAAANQVCKSLGGISNGTNGWRAENGFGHSNNIWNTYVLP